MRITVRNLGAIEEAEVDVKPLTIFVGPNNSGKTWLACTLASLFGPYGLGRSVRAYSKGDIPALPLLDQAIQQVLEEGSAKINLVEFIETSAELYFNNVAKQARHWLQEFLGLERLTFENLDIQIDLSGVQDNLKQKILNRRIDARIAEGRIARYKGRQKAQISALKEPGEPDLSLYTTSEESGALEKLPEQAIRRFIVEEVLRAIHEAFYNEIYTFPTERTAFITLPLYRKVTEENTTEEIREEEQARKTLPAAVGQFLRMMFLLYATSQVRREREARRNRSIKRFIELSQILEQEILGGGLDFSTKEPDALREIHFKPGGNVVLEISAVSSMVKELSPLVLYLRYLAQPGELLIIDEPEMNLHPEAQAKIIEFLAMLVKADLHVLITTHSTYIVDHLVNLMEAAKYTDEEARNEIAARCFLGKTDAFIAQDDVSVYLFGKKVCNILSEDGRINWATFSDVTDRIESLHDEL